MAWMRSISLAAIAGCVYLYAARAPAELQAAPTPMDPGFVDFVALSGLNMPTAVRFSPDGRVFVAEKSGIIKVFDNLSDPQPTVFADLRSNVHNYWDRGLLGLELDPGFPARPYVYVLYTYDGRVGGPAPRWGLSGQTSDGCPDPPGGTADGCDVSGRLSRLQAAGNVMTGAEQVLIHDWFQQYPSHGMGSLAFGGDGALYVSAGDGASWQFVDYGQRGNPGGDPPVGVGGLQTPPAAEGGALRSQDVRTSSDAAGLGGTVIRIDPNTGAARADNPLAASTDPNVRRIVAYGLRNPFRMTVRPGTRELWIGDVGWRDWEEINLVADPLSPTVRNFGWPCYEGRGRQPGYDAANLHLCESLYTQTGAVTFPHFQYAEGAAVVAGESCPNADSSTTGLTFYRGGSYPARYTGALFFADYTRRCIWVMFAGTTGRPDPATRAVFIADAAYPVDLQIGPGGDLYYVDIAGGAIHRVRYSADNAPPRAILTTSATSGAAPLTVAFDGRQSSDVEDSALGFDWDLNGDGIFGDASIATPTYTYSVDGTVTAVMRVIDSGGLADTTRVSITVGNTQPTAIIETPSSTLRWSVGQSVSFSGRASDPEQGALPASALTWMLIMNHCSSETSCHEHVIREYAGTASGSFVAVDHDYPSYLTLRLTATDAGGLQHRTTRRLDPQTVDLTFQTSPAGLTLGVGSGAVRTPDARRFIVGSTVSVGAPSPQTLSGTSYTFRTWSDGGAQTHTVVAGGTPATYLATYGVAMGTGGGEVVMHAARAPVRAGAWRSVSDTTAAGGARMEHPDAGASKLDAPLANPTNYFELRFHAEARRAYRLWVRARASGNSYRNDSVYVQFSGSATEGGSPTYRIGTTSATAVVLEDCSGCSISGWGWQDNGYGRDTYGPVIYFAETGQQSIRIQGREDGVSIDQLVLSAGEYLSRAPGTLTNDTTILPERPAAASEVVRYAATAAVRTGTWRLVADSTAAGGARLEHPNADVPKLAPSAAPRDYFELPFAVEAGQPYRLWIRGRAAGDSYRNDSVHVQFSDARDQNGASVYRIGTSSATAVILEECSGCGLSGWGWADNGYSGAGPLIYFATSGVQTVRVQGREDGISIDQVVLSRGTYLTRAPGQAKNDGTILR